jgi:hypothetical protein
MTSGFEWDEGIERGRAQSLFDMSRSADWVQFILVPIQSFREML